MAKSVRTLFDGVDFVAADIGARGDIPVAWLPLDGNARIVAFDADPKACRELLATYASRGHGDRYQVIAAALGACDETRPLFLTHARGGSSLFDPDTAMNRAYVDAEYIFPIERSEIRLEPAARVFERTGLRHIDLMKLDVQGFELEILRGFGAELMSNVLGVELEIALQNKGNGYPDISVVHPFLLESGFELYDIQPIRVHRTLDGSRWNAIERTFGVSGESPSIARRIWEINAVYFRPPEKLRPGSTDIWSKLAICFCLYGFFSEALHSIGIGEQSLTVPPATASQLRGAIKEWHRSTRFRRRYMPNGFGDIFRAVLRRLGLAENPPWWPYG